LEVLVTAVDSVEIRTLVPIKPKVPSENECTLPRPER